MLLFQTIGNLLSAGKIPDVPQLEKITPAEEQKKAIAGNLANFDAAATLTDKTNTFSFDQQMKNITKLMPGFAGMLDQESGNISSLLKGEIPQDVQDMIKRMTAFKSMSGGFSGSEAGSNLTARDFGLTSLSLMESGAKQLDAASRWMSQAFSPAMNITSMFLTPVQQYGMDVEERNTQWNREWLQDKVNALPDPSRAAIGQAIIKTDDQIMSMASSVLGILGGGGMGGLGGGGKSKGGNYSDGAGSD